MGIERLPQSIRDNYEVYEWRHACPILEHEFPKEWSDLIDALNNFKLNKSYITTRGGNKSLAAKHIDTFLYSKGWEERQFDTKVVIDSNERISPTHKVDCYRNRVAVEIE